MIAALLLLTSVVPIQLVERSTEGRVSLAWMLWFDDPFNRGEIACDKGLERLQREQFDRLFHRRIALLRERYLTAHGPDPDFDVSGGYACVRGRKKANRIFAKAIARFNAKLLDFERRYPDLRNGQRQ